MPDWSKDIRALLAGLKLEPLRESEIVEELAEHLDDRYRELVSSGQTAEQARAKILEELKRGRLDTHLRPLVPAMSSPPVLGQHQRGNRFFGIWKDLNYAARTLRLNPGFSVIAILSLMLGIGANTAIFQLLDAVRLRTLPVKNPQELSDVHIQRPPHGRTGEFRGRISHLTNDIWEKIRDQQQAFSNIGAWGVDSANLDQGR
jgi:putative ABC transport system permease protein